MSELLAQRRQAFDELMEACSDVVAPCLWCQTLLRRNGVAAAKLHVVRQALPSSSPTKIATSGDVGRPPKKRRLAFLGRLDPIKGVDLLIRAWLETPALQFDLDIYAVAQSEADESRLAALRSMARHDPRISFLEPIPQADVVPRLRSYDGLVVPSRALETGPLVVLEAFAAGCPVIGSALGGISELVHDGVDGLLVEPTPEGWRNRLSTLAEDPDTLQRLRKGVRPPRQTSDLVAEMIPIYERAVARTA